ncbi:hypothetical protein RIF29_41649 [Crotalaria pallida]|uniref:Uncharacterized protein n=1 Tax=Crotalaria pallida TaxID=3830 RepID=A0AAN9HRQ6_CROPI
MQFYHHFMTSAPYLNIDWEIQMACLNGLLVANPKKNPRAAGSSLLSTTSSTNARQSKSFKAPDSIATPETVKRRELGATLNLILTVP